jgi:hypothetical protein
MAFLGECALLRANLDAIAAGVDLAARPWTPAAR